MIKITITGRDARVIKFESVGHASIESGSRGKNLVCCAVGILVQTLYLFTKKEDLLTAELVKEGELALEFTNEKQKLLVDSIDLTLTGLENLKEQFPNEIEIIYNLNEVKYGA